MRASSVVLCLYVWRCGRGASAYGGEQKAEGDGLLGARHGCGIAVAGVVVAELGKERWMERAGRAKGNWSRAGVKERMAGLFVAMRIPGQTGIGEVAEVRRRRAGAAAEARDCAAPGRRAVEFRGPEYVARAAAAAAAGRGGPCSHLSLLN